MKHSSVILTIDGYLENIKALELHYSTFNQLANILAGNRISSKIDFYSN